jgi:N-acetylmuramate 1-kinase
MTQEPKATRWTVALQDEGETGHLADEVMLLVGADDLLTLSGDLGAGKTSFARALIRRLAQDPELEVPSPTFTLMQVYETNRFPIVHADLYRIKNEDEILDLGWDEASTGALMMVEWADRLGDLTNPDRLDIAFHLDLADGPTARIAVLTGHGKFAERLERARAIHDLLMAGGWAQATRHHMQGDASTRAYERLMRPDGKSAVLMISPPRPDKIPVRLGKTYSTLVHRAQTIDAFLAIAEGLVKLGFSAPTIYAADRPTGLAIIEDLGTEPFTHNNAPIPERYLAALEVLATLHSMELPKTLPIGSSDHVLPPYDLDALSVEVELLTDWYVPHVAHKSLSSAAKAQFVNVWRRALHGLIHAKTTWVLRDYHSPNLIWMPERNGMERVGILDFQDCVIGHPAYDVASLLQDARVTVPDAMEIQLLGAYLGFRRSKDPAFDVNEFAKAYALMGAQRATKILGIFARLDKRDAKPQYLQHIPRIEHYLAKDIAHPGLRDLRSWFSDYVPHLIGHKNT